MRRQALRTYIKNTSHYFHTSAHLLCIPHVYNFKEIRINLNGARWRPSAIASTKPSLNICDAFFHTYICTFISFCLIGAIISVVFKINSHTEIILINMTSFLFLLATQLKTHIAKVASGLLEDDFIIIT